MSDPTLPVYSNFGEFNVFAGAFSDKLPSLDGVCLDVKLDLPRSGGKGRERKKFREKRTKDTYALQAFLVRTGNLSLAKITGEFDTPTGEALKAYQEREGIDPTGVYDAATRAHIQSKGSCAIPQ